MRTLASTTLLFALCFGAIGAAHADCAADSTVQDVQQAFARGQRRESAGDMRGALRAYYAAQDYTCDPNPVEGEAARRAAAIAPPLAVAEEKKGKHLVAFELYELGGHYAAADRALMAHVRANPDSPEAFAKAYHVLQERGMGYFAANNGRRIAAAGGYEPQPQFLAELSPMPRKGVERALQKEAASFKEAYFREYVKLVQSRPDDPSDFEAMQRMGQAEQAFRRKWREDPLEQMRKALRLADSWSSVAPDAQRSELGELRLQRLTARAETLARDFSGAPDLLEKAADFFEDAQQPQRAEEVRARALALGNAADASQRYTLAAAYYDAAGADDKADAVREKQQQLAMSRMQPSIDAAQRQAEELQKAFGDPAPVEAMRQQAEAARKAMEAQRQNTSRGQAQKSAEDLEKELGL